MTDNKTILAFLAHPDDAEFMCAGTLALLARKGWNVHIATMTPGDCGSVQYSREEISRIRKGEAAGAAALIGAQYHCAECDDLFFMYDRPTLVKTLEIIRRVRPDVVVALPPVDYHVDHETASRLVRSACFGAGVPNAETPGVEAYEPIPTLYYTDSHAGKDHYGRDLKPEFHVDVTSVIETKEKMLARHQSQRDWLMAHHGIDEYILLMKRFGQQRGKEIGVDYAEGFVQYLAPPFPQENILKTELGGLVHLDAG